MSAYRRLWESGELAAVARECSSAQELAKRLNVTVEALGTGLRRLRREGLNVPMLSDMFGNGPRVVPRAAVPPVEVPEYEIEVLSSEAIPANDGWDEQTNPGMSFPRAAPIEREREILEPVEEHRLRMKVRELERLNKELISRIAASEDRLAVIAESTNHRYEPIKPREWKSGHREGTAVVLASDWHVEEEVKPEKVQGRNRFNLEIAEQRMTRFWAGTRWFINAQRQDFKIRDAVVWLGGDMFTNYLHDDNIETNLLAPPAAFAFAKQGIVEGLKFLLQDTELETINVVCNDGNHGRLTKDLRAASRHEMSLEALMYGMIAQDFKHEPRMRFEIAQGDHVYTEVYNTTVRWTHGAEVRYGGGVGGIMIPLYKALSRWDTVRRADLTCVGHFHQLTSLNDLVINGSLIGYSPYALRIGARFERPQQAAFIIDSKRGKSVSAPIWVSDAEEDELAA